MKHSPAWNLIIGTTAFAFMAACVKAVSSQLPLYEVILFRTSITALILAFFLYRLKIPFMANNLGLLLLRSFSGFGAMICHFYCLRHLSFGDTATLMNTAPLFVALFSMVFLGERPSKALIAYILLAWLGIGLVLRPEMNFFNSAGLIALLGAILTAIVAIVIRQSHATEPTIRIAFYFTAISALLTIPWTSTHFVMPSSSSQWALLVAMGLFGTIGQFFVTRAYGLGEVSQLSPLTYIGVLEAFILGLIFWGEEPTLLAILGSTFVIFCCYRIIQERNFTAPLKTQ